MQICSGDTINAPVTSATLVNTATVNATNEIPSEQNATSTATITLVATTIGGTVFCDNNLNGVLDSCEGLEAGAIVTLSGSGVSKTATTGSNGSYQFTNLAPGTYTVTLTTPSSGDVAELSHGSVVISQSRTVTLAAGGSSTNNNFAQVDLGSLSGTVFLDLNDNGCLSSGEPGVANATVTITGSNYLGMSISQTTTTNSNGQFSFPTQSGTLLPSNSNGYTIQVTPPSGDMNGVAAPGTLGGTTSCNSGTISHIVLPGCNNSGTGYNFGELGIFHGLTATIGFWHNQNGQALINSFGTCSSGQSLANFLAASFPNLSVAKAPAFKVNSTIGTNLTNRSNSDVASYFLSLFGVSGQKTYAQVLATALAEFTTTNSLDTGSASRALAIKYGFVLSTQAPGRHLSRCPRRTGRRLGLPAQVVQRGPSPNFSLRRTIMPLRGCSTAGTRL